jgi:antitoxin component HigA of HigAB toxin-antitoxin module
MGDAPAEGGDATELIRQALELVRQYAAQEESETGTLDAEKITTLLQSILANEEKELEDAMAGKASPKMLRSAYGA